MDFIQRDRGHIRRGSEKTLDSRAQAFRSWCDRHSIGIRHFQAITPEGIIEVLGQFILEVSQGHNPTKRSDLHDKTLCEYLQAAARLLKVACPELHVPLYSASGGSTKSDKLHPYLANILSDRRNWQQPKEMKQPISREMLDTMEAKAQAYIATGTYRKFGRLPALWDLACLACYTGSRLGEYGVSRQEAGSPFPRIPNSPDVPEIWRGQPVAFIPKDFEFFDKGMHLLPWSEAWKHPHKAVILIVRFRYDKSPNNFTKRKFKRVNGNFCPVRAAWSILDRYHSCSQRYPDEPIGFFTADNGRRTNTSSRHIKKFLTEICEEAHPNPNHYLRQHIDQLVSHSFRVTAAVALSNAEVSIDDITFRLRWNSDAVRRYLRDGARAITELSFKAMQGAYMSTDDDTGNT